MSKYKHIYFDLDRTLWDFEANAREALKEIFHLYGLEDRTGGFQRFVDLFKKYNDMLWERYQKGLINKEHLRNERFRLILKDFKIVDQKLTSEISSVYLEITPSKTILVEGALEVLGQLKMKHRLYILTNGFPEIQNAKIGNSGLKPFFDRIITSEHAGRHKPHRRAFEYALKCANAKKSESIMVGDDLEVDILGAKDFGMDQAYFNRDGKVHDAEITFEITVLNELPILLQ